LQRVATLSQRLNLAVTRSKSFAAAFMNVRVLTVTLMGFASGLPFALSGSTLQAWFATVGIDVKTVGMFGLVGLPYTCKFLWAPLIDRFYPPALGRRRGWILLTQLGLLFSLSLLAFMDPQVNILSMGLLALMIAFLSATQDIAIDAYRTDLLNPTELGIGAAVFVAGYRIAIVISGAVALWMAQGFGWQSTYLFMVGLTMLCMLVTWYSPVVGQQPDAPMTLKAAVVEPFWQFLQRKKAGYFLLLIFSYKLGDAFLNSVSTYFLLRGVEFSLVDVAAMNKVLGVASNILGAFVGGIILLRISLFQGLLYFGVIQAISNLSFMLLAIAGKKYALLALAVFAENFCGGLGTAAFFALLMALCDKRYSATQYALFSALFGLARVIASPVSGYLVADVGWINFFMWTFIFALPGLGLVWFLRKQIEDLGIEAVQQQD
jgi:PAT family beta-lactamase induction signal transducer AmpG